MAEKSKLKIIAPNKQRVFLIGMPASGKTTFGLQLAKALGYRFIDTDEIIEERAGMTIANLFRTKGEPHFRALEKETLQSIKSERMVVATGGGMPCFFDNMDFILENGVAIYLDVPASALAERTQIQQGTRPLLSSFDGDELRQALEEKLYKREAFYLQAPIHLSTPNILVEKALVALQKEGLEISNENK